MGALINNLVRMGRISDPRCVYCEEEKSVKHMMFSCMKWDYFRLSLNTILDHDIIPKNVQNLLCGPTDEDMLEESELRRVAVE